MRPLMYEPVPEPQPHPLRYLKRGFALRCPECGVSPIFKPLRETRSMFDWLTPLDGCPGCGYAYQREQGYFLIAIWVLNYGVVAGLALLLSFIAEAIWAPPMWVHVVTIFAPMPILSLLLARHAKSLFIAVDHYCDPHVKTPPSTDPPR